VSRSDSHEGPADREPVLPSPTTLERAGLIATGVLGAAWTGLPALLGFWLLAELGAIGDWLEARPGEAIWIYAGLFAVSSGLGLLPTYAQAILGGWVFGPVIGLVAALAGFVGGSSIGYVVARLVARGSVESWIARKPKAAVVREALVGHGFWKSVLVVALLRMPPNSPFALTNLAMSVAGVRLGPFLLGTAIGMLPRTAIAVWLAAAAAATGAEDIQAFASERGVWLVAGGVVSMVVVVAVIGSMAKAALRRLAPDAAAEGS
jgi:uncharacterized membrane protein YdjX (TVP38/TMEM64 family)